MAMVLVVDDEPQIRDVVARYLRRDGHQVVAVENGVDARSIIESRSPNLVVLDVMLPGGLDGLSLCRWIRASSDLPVILLTAADGGSRPDRRARARRRRLRHEAVLAARAGGSCAHGSPARARERGAA